MKTDGSALPDFLLPDGVGAVEEGELTGHEVAQQQLFLPLPC